MVHYCEIKRNCWRVIYFESTPNFLISQSKARLQVVLILSLSLIVSNSVLLKACQPGVSQGDFPGQVKGGMYALDLKGAHHVQN